MLVEPATLINTGGGVTVAPQAVRLSSKSPIKTNMQDRQRRRGAGVQGSGGAEGQGGTGAGVKKIDFIRLFAIRLFASSSHQRHNNAKNAEGRTVRRKNIKGVTL